MAGHIFYSRDIKDSIMFIFPIFISTCHIVHFDFFLKIKHTECLLPPEIRQSWIKSVFLFWVFFSILPVCCDWQLKNTLRDMCFGFLDTCNTCFVTCNLAYIHIAHARCVMLLISLFWKCLWVLICGRAYSQIRRRQY